VPDLTTTPIYLCGPLASGKSALAVSLAHELDGEIVNADVAQLYRGLEVLSSAPPASEQEKVPHHLYSVLDVSENCDALNYRQLSLPVIEEIQSRGKVPIITGGSGLHLKYLTHGPSPIPESDKALREKLEERSDEDLISELKELDPNGAEATDLKNRRYVIRALEICLLTGEKMSKLKEGWNKKSAEINESLRGLYLLWENEALKKRVSSRCMEILEKGGVEEVKAVRERASEICRKIIGFTEIEQHLEGKLTLQECHKGLHRSTRRYAKRQRSWLRREGWLEDVVCPITDHSLIKSIR